MSLSGKCFCGAVTYQAEGPILWAGHCHCDSCRRTCSAPMTSFFGVPREGVTWSGEVRVHVSSPGVERGFCAVCGTPMFYRSDAWPKETHLYAASLLEPTAFKPEAHYHWGEKLPWLKIEDSLPKHAASADA